MQLGAVLRLTHLVVADRIMRPVRDMWTRPLRDPISEEQVGDSGRALFQRPGGGTRYWDELPGWRRWISTLLHCPWCVGLWLSFGVVAATLLLPPEALWCHAALTISWVAGLVESRVGD